MGATPHLQRMGNDNEGLAVLAVQSNHQVDDARGGLGVQITGGFIGPDDGGSIDQSPGECHPLPLAPGELTGQVVRSVS